MAANIRSRRDDTSTVMVDKPAERPEGSPAFPVLVGYGVGWVGAGVGAGVGVGVGAGWVAGGAVS